LKTTLTTALVLALPNLQKPFLIEIDASDKGIGALHQQEGHLVAYVSKALGPRNQNSTDALSRVPSGPRQEILAVSTVQDV